VGENGRFFLLQGPQKKFAGRPLAGERRVPADTGRRPAASWEGSGFGREMRANRGIFHHLRHRGLWEKRK